MFETPGRSWRLWTVCGLACTIVVLCGCGQRGALYMPDRNARVVTRPAGSQPDGASSAPASDDQRR
jgi:predicted small lipoprotein YifL